MLCHHTPKYRLERLARAVDMGPMRELRPGSALNESVRAPDKWDLNSPSTIDIYQLSIWFSLLVLLLFPLFFFLLYPNLGNGYEMFTMHECVALVHEDLPLTH